jgi:hypothetical protein
MGQWSFGQALDVIAAAEVRTPSPEGGPRPRLHEAVERRVEPVLIVAVETFSVQMSATAMWAAEKRIAARAEDYAPMVAMGAWDVPKATAAIMREEERRPAAWPAPREAVAAGGGGGAEGRRCGAEDACAASGGAGRGASRCSGREGGADPAGAANVAVTPLGFIAPYWMGASKDAAWAAALQ